MSLKPKKLKSKRKLKEKQVSPPKLTASSITSVKEHALKLQSLMRWPLHSGKQTTVKILDKHQPHAPDRGSGWLLRFSVPKSHHGDTARSDITMITKDQVQDMFPEAFHFRALSGPGTFVDDFLIPLGSPMMVTEEYNDVVKEMARSKPK